MTILRQYLNKSRPITKNNDALFVGLITIFTIFFLSISIIKSSHVIMILIMLLFIICFFTIEIFDKNRAYRVVKAGMFTLAGIYGVFLLSSYFNPTDGIINFFNLEFKLLLIRSFSIFLALYLSIYAYAKFKNKGIFKYLFARILFAIAAGLSLYLIITIYYGIIQLPTFAILRMTIVGICVAIVALYLLVFAFQDYGFKNNNNNNKRFNKNEKYNATNAKSPASAKRYGKPARRN